MLKQEMYQMHIRMLLKRYNIRVLKWIHWGNRGATGYAYLGERKVIIPIPKTLKSFYIALHEIGHIVRRFTSGDEYYLEYLAETWAFNHMEQWGYDIPIKYRWQAKAYVFKYLIKDWKSGKINRSNVKKEVVKWLGITLAELDMATWDPVGFGILLRQTGSLK